MSSGRCLEPIRKKIAPSKRTGPTESMATVRLVTADLSAVGPRRSRRTALPRPSSHQAGVPNRPGDPAQQDRRADISEEMNQEDEQGVTRGAAIRRHNVGRDRVRRAREPSPSAPMPRTAGRARRCAPDRECPRYPAEPPASTTDAGQQQIGAPGVLAKKSATNVESAMPTRPATASKMPMESLASFIDMPRTRLIEGRPPGGVGPRGERGSGHPRRVVDEGPRLEELRIVAEFGPVGLAGVFLALRGTPAGVENSQPGQGRQPARECQPPGTRDASPSARPPDRR